MEVIIPPCSNNDQISKDIYAFLKKQGNSIPISQTQMKGGGMYEVFSQFINGDKNTIQKEKENPIQKEKENPIEENTNTIEDKSPPPTRHITKNSNSILLEFNDKKHTIENIKGSKLYFLISRNGNNECARWI
jgi:hypothetical protein